MQLFPFQQQVHYILPSTLATSQYMYSTFCTALCTEIFHKIISDSVLLRILMSYLAIPFTSENVLSSWIYSSNTFSTTPQVFVLSTCIITIPSLSKLLHSLLWENACQYSQCNSAFSFLAPALTVAEFAFATFKNANCQFDHHFVVQTSEREIGSRHQFLCHQHYV